MANKQKTKGKNYEREIADIFSTTFGQSFTRVPNSGAFFGGINARRLDSYSANQIQMFSGDIIPPDNWSILIECKSRKDFKFHLLLREKGNLDLNSWIDQASIDFEKSKLNLMLVIFKPNNCGSYVCFDFQACVRNEKYTPDNFEPSTFSLHTGTNFLTYKYKDKTYIITELDEFLINNKELIQKLCQKNISQ